MRRGRSRRWRAGEVDVTQIPLLTGAFKIVDTGEVALTGDAPKSFVVFPTKRLYGKAYFAKGPRKQGPRECVTEYLITCIGQTLPLRIAAGRLVILPSSGTSEPDVRYMSRYFLRTDLAQQLVHGVELVAEGFDLDENTVRAEIPRGTEADFYTIDLVEQVLMKVARTPAEGRKLMHDFVRMLAFDSVVGANDRHARNWGIIRSALDREAPQRFSPVFDTARGLFWNYSDAQLAAQNTPARRDAFIKKYAESSGPKIGIPGRRWPNHFDLVHHLLAPQFEGRFTRAVTSVIDAFSPDRCVRVIRNDFKKILSPVRREFIEALLRFRHGRLKSIRHDPTIGLGRGAKE